MNQEIDVCNTLQYTTYFGQQVCTGQHCKQDYSFYFVFNGLEQSMCIRNVTLRSIGLFWPVLITFDFAFIYCIKKCLPCECLVSFFTTYTICLFNKLYTAISLSILLNTIQKTDVESSASTLTEFNSTALDFLFYTASCHMFQDQAGVIRAS